MKSLLVFAGVVSAQIGAFVAPVAGDLRGPCPGLNTLANHGLLPHDGKNITREQLVNAMRQGLNQDESISFVLFTQAVRSNPSGDNTSFSLTDLGRHNILEHDASLSRKDSILGDPSVFDATVFARTKAAWAGLETIDLQAAAAARAVQLRNSVATNPEFRMSPLAWSFLVGESIAPVLVFGDVVAGTAPRASVEFLYENEQFPPGYAPQANVVTNANLQDLQIRMSTTLMSMGFGNAEVNKMRRRGYGHGAW